MARWLCAIAVVIAVSACANPRPAATPTAAAVPTLPPAPAAAPSPSAQTIASLGEDMSDVAAAFLENVLDVTDEASAMAESSCDDLKLAQADNPTVFRSVQSYAATLKRLAAVQPDLTQEQQIKQSLSDLDLTMGELEGALRLCGITP